MAFTFDAKKMTADDTAKIHIEAYTTDLTTITKNIVDKKIKFKSEDAQNKISLASGNYQKLMGALKGKETTFPKSKKPSKRRWTRKTSTRKPSRTRSERATTLMARENDDCRFSLCRPFLEPDEIESAVTPVLPLSLEHQDRENAATSGRLARRASRPIRHDVSRTRLTRPTKVASQDSVDFSGGRVQAAFAVRTGRQGP